MAGLTILLLISSPIFVQGRPQLNIANVGDNVGDALNQVTGVAQLVAAGVLANAQRAGGELRDMASDVINGSVSTVLQVNNALGEMAVGSLHATRSLVDAADDYVRDNLKDAGRFASTAVRGSTNGVGAVADLTGSYATGVTVGVIRFLQETADAIGELAANLVENSVSLTRNAGGVVGDFTDGTVRVLTGYDASAQNLLAD